MNIIEITAKILRQVDSSTVIYALGAGVLAVWLLRNSLGREALVRSQPRRNNMPRYVPFAVLIFWVTITTLGLALSEQLFEDKPDEVGVLWDNLMQCVGATVSIALVVYFARKSFARRLKGFGLNLKKLPKDIPYACLNLLAAWPVVVAVLVVTSMTGKYLFGPGFEIEPHQELQTVRQFSQSIVAVAILINAAIVTPVFEEMLFRGLFQTMIRSYVVRPWVSILISSVLFAAVHANMAHWPALFVLGMCMGYAYERSGSLLRPMIIHSLFNGLAVVAVLLD